ncbi:MAG: hypothetical protein XU09_C0003G0039 [Thaumarchaeota archaeon CSP1-1]|nr:MAG: hypothetical protein XU09_C0003G0039 [Thaumarchaeota archaeon CSP1-1]
MNKKLISVLATIVLLGTLTGVSEAKSSTPFGYTSTGVDIVDFELDFKDIEVMLDVQVTEIPSTLEITFEREFFDSTNLDQDSEFTIIADGDLVYYDEIVTNSKLRTLKFNLSSDVELVEIFGTHLKGIIAQDPIIEVTEEILTTQVEQAGKINELIEENQVLREENNILKEENEELDGRIFELENLVSALEVQVTNLNTIVTEQIKVIYNWVLGYSIN